jgi:2-polyprenyl-3-methyl-5-hydroxy-6-metoxy-1,4-benzoquinol methylase
MNCRICDSDDLYLYFTVGNSDEYKYYRCRKCHHVNYDLSSGLDQEKYTQVYVDPDDKALKINSDQVKSYQFIKKNIPVRGDILDIGCGNGKLLLMARDDGWKVQGLELSELFAQTINRLYGIDVKTANFLDFDALKSDKYDCIVLRHVLEHLPDSKLAMRKINSLLKDHGYAMLEFPNIESLEANNKRLLKRLGFKKYKKFPVNFKPGHCNEFCRTSFVKLAETTGFKVIHWETYSTNAISDFFYNLLPIGTKARALVQKL